MKWYWAILITFGLLAIPFVLLLNGAPDKSIDTLITAIVAVTAIYAGVTTGSFGWGLFVFLVWPIGFPAYLMFAQRRETTDCERPRSSTGPHSEEDEGFSDLDVYREVTRRDAI